MTARSPQRAACAAKATLLCDRDRGEVRRGGQNSLADRQIRHEERGGGLGRIRRWRVRAVEAAAACLCLKPLHACVLCCAVCIQYCVLFCTVLCTVHCAASPLVQRLYVRNTAKRGECSIGGSACACACQTRQAGSLCPGSARPSFLSRPRRRLSSSSKSSSSPPPSHGERGSSGVWPPPSALSGPPSIARLGDTLCCRHHGVLTGRRHSPVLGGHSARDSEWMRVAVKRATGEGEMDGWVDGRRSAPGWGTGRGQACKEQPTAGSSGCVRACVRVWASPAQARADGGQGRTGQGGGGTHARPGRQPTLWIISKCLEQFVLGTYSKYTTAIVSTFHCAAAK